MKKINILVNDTDAYINFFRNPNFHDIVWEHFNILLFDPSATYDKTDVIIATHNYHSDLSTQWFSKFMEDGFKIIFDNLWEENIIQQHGHVLINKNWFWYNESLWYKRLNYNEYIPTKTYEKLAFMPMRFARTHRDSLLDKMTPLLDDFIFSYVHKGISLPNDTEQNSNDFQRYFNPSWYDDTYFSIVAETTIGDCNLLVTEKTFKPIAFSHPFLIYGQCGILNFLKQNGFETFENLFDETYDEVTDANIRLNMIYNNVLDFKKIKYDKLTSEKLQHNKNLFFDDVIVKEKIISELIDPIKDYIER
jgi:hypothetical protein